MWHGAKEKLQHRSFMDPPQPTLSYRYVNRLTLYLSMHAVQPKSLPSRSIPPGWDNYDNEISHLTHCQTKITLFNVTIKVKLHMMYHALSGCEKDVWERELSIEIHHHHSDTNPTTEATWENWLTDSGSLTAIWLRKVFVSKKILRLSRMLRSEKSFWNDMNGNTPLCHWTEWNQQEGCHRASIVDSVYSKCEMFRNIPVDEMAWNSCANITCCYRIRHL